MPLPVAFPGCHRRWHPGNDIMFNKSTFKGGPLTHEDSRALVSNFLIGRSVDHYKKKTLENLFVNTSAQKKKNPPEPTAGGWYARRYG